MKIGETSNQFPDFPHQKKVKEKGGSAPSKGVGAKADTEFAGAFLNVAQESLKASLDELVGEVQAQGERLAKKQNFTELNRYKDLVRSFLAKVGKDLYKIEASTLSKPLPGQRVYVILQKVDLELEKLTKMVLAGQVPQLQILERLDQIRGLLLDAYK
jgi:uncharacterized protein YaaR (DUF327 family)